MLPERILPPFRDEEAVVLDMIEGYFASRGRVVHTGDQTPDDERIEDVLPFIRVGRVGGAPRRGDEHTDRPVIDVDVLATTRREAKEIANEIEQLLMRRAHPIDTCNVLIGPQRVPWVEGSKVVRLYASYHLGLRR